MAPEGLVGGDEDLVLPAVPERGEGRPHLRRADDGHGHVLAAAAEPLVELRAPVLHQGGGADDQGLPADRSTFWPALRQERPDDRHRLQRLTQAHVVGQDAAGAIEALEAHEAVKEELHADPLVLPQHARDLAVQHDLAPSLRVLGLRRPEHEPGLGRVLRAALGVRLRLLRPLRGRLLEEAHPGDRPRRPREPRPEGLPLHAHARRASHHRRLEGPEGDRPLLLREAQHGHHRLARDEARPALRRRFLRSRLF
mmetsp:Transcript_43628/g.125946  ORF Transcript_43628/g.125946 Transcript_43628/m.125946 type:complete len:254 (+) Transcript_43628:1674-2435(+)